MLRPDVHNRKIRKSDFVFVSGRAKSASQARHCTGYVFEHSARAGGVVYRSGKIKPSQPVVSGRCGTSHAAILVAFMANKKLSLDLQRFIAAWRGHAQWADTYNLRLYLEKQYAIAF